MDIAHLFDVKGKRAFVTGGSGGIGYMIAQGLLEAGAHVTICSRKADAIERAAQALSAFGPCTGFAADLGTEEGVATAAAHINAAGPLNILVNNAGAAWGAPIDKFPRAGFTRVLDLNLTGIFGMTQALLPVLRAAATKDDPARVINIASIDGMDLPMWETYSYSASKAGLLLMSRHMGRTLAPDNISVNCISPGFFPSKMTAGVIDFNDPEAMKQAGSPLGGRAGEPEDIAAAVIYLSSRAGAWLTGINIPVSGGTRLVD